MPGDSPTPLHLVQMMHGAAHGGAENFFVALAAALQEQVAQGALRQRLLIRPDSARLAQLAAAGCAVEPVRFGGSLSLLARLRLRRRLAALQPDVVLAWMNRAAAVLPQRRRFASIGRLGGAYDLKYYRNCDHLVFNTPMLRDGAIRSGWPAERASVISNFTDLQPAAQPVPRASLQTPAGVPLLLALGRLHENKGFDLALRALALLPDAVLWIAGEGPERQRLTRLGGELGVMDRVRLLGWRQDRAALLAAADLLLVPSRIEPLGNVVLEGFACGVPVVAAASDGPSWLIEDGVHGRLVPREAPERLAAAIVEVLAEPATRAAMVAAASARLQAEFSRAAVVGRYLALFESLRRSRG